MYTVLIYVMKITDYLKIWYIFFKNRMAYRTILLHRTKNGNITSKSYRKKICIYRKTPTEQMEKLFSRMPYELQNVKDVKTDIISKANFDIWQRDILDASKINNYGASVGAETNSIIKQKKKQLMTLFVW